MKEKLVLIDGHSILNRAFYGVPDLTNAKGIHTNAIYGFLNILFKVLEEEKPEYLAVAFDVHAPTFRHDMYKEYKGTRKPMPEELRQQVPIMKEVLSAMGILTMEKPGLEADDILGTCAKKAEKHGLEVSLVSGDRDLLQIASSTIKIRIPKTKMGRTEVEDYYEQDVLAAYHVTPKQFIELKALMGDTADNIPGVPKVGQKTATDLIATYGSIENIYANIDQISKKSIRESLAQNKELADLSLRLATIKTDADLDDSYTQGRVGNLYTQEAYLLFQQLEFKNFLNRFQVVKDSESVKYQLLKTEIEIKDFFSKIKNFSEIGCMLCVGKVDKEDDVNRQEKWSQNKLLGMAFYAKGLETENYFVLISADFDVAMLKKELCNLIDNGVQIYTAWIKELYAFLEDDFVVCHQQQFFDVIIAAYVLNPLKNDYQIEDLSNEFLGYMPQSYAQLFGKKTMDEVWNSDQTGIYEYICGCAQVIARVTPILREKLTETQQEYVFYQIEMPLSGVLFRMEKEGVLVKPQELKEYGEELGKKISQLETSIYDKAGEKFNINSPKQLGEILFGKMQIPGGKKTKSGYSTAADVLEKLAPSYPIVNEILEYRGLTKLKSTYADGLAGYIGKDHRIHTTFQQTVTATGRISSTEPNLQNIPMRMELGKRIRKVFVAREGYVLMDADYSQIELRILASMAKDQQLIEAYQEEADIHKITASKVFHVSLTDVTELQRRNAKAVNFGIVYGISSFGLSQDLSISRKEASEYIQKYFETYPGIKRFLDESVHLAKTKGFSVTFFGRRRPIPELTSSNFMQRSFGERVAMNAPIQGTAADIMKIAMIQVDRRLREEGLQTRMILQVHDELLLETAKDEVQKVKQIVTEEMMNAAQLTVALKVDLHTGDNWYDAH